jgi:hypothetical protein
MGPLLLEEWPKEIEKIMELRQNYRIVREQEEQGKRGNIEMESQNTPFPFSNN